MRRAELNRSCRGSVVSRSALGRFRNLEAVSPAEGVSDFLLTPLVTAFQASYPNVRVQILCHRAPSRSYRRGRRFGVPSGARRDSSLVARRVLTYRHQLVASPSCQDVQTAERTAGPSRPSVADFLSLAARESLDLRSQERDGQGNFDLPASLLNERLYRLGASLGRRGRDRGASASGPAKAHPGRPSGRGHARLAVPHLRPLAHPDREPPRHQAMPDFQGSRGANGAKSVSRPADVSN